MPVNRYGQSLNFGTGISGLYIPPTKRACNQREINHTRMQPKRIESYRSSAQAGQRLQTIKEKEII